MNLIEKLEAIMGGPFPAGSVGTCWHRNPDGPEAAARIRELEAENAALRASLERPARIAALERDMEDTHALVTNLCADLRALDCGGEGDGS